MTDLEHILPLWKELEAAGVEYVLATVVAVEGSSYRKPGARMLLAADGRRAGTVSGGCLEAAVAKKAWWHTDDGPAVRPYSTLEDDGELPYGSGCGGIVWILLERSSTAGPLMQALSAAFEAREPLAIATVLEGETIGQRAYAGPGYTAQAVEADIPFVPRSSAVLRITPRNFAVEQLLSDKEAQLIELAEKGLERGATFEAHVDGARVWVDYRRARPGLWIIGAGDDAKPMVRLARTLGWFVAVADGRSHLATAARFPEADVVYVLPHDFELLPGDAAVIMTHSFEQDSCALARLLSAPVQPTYIGVLGPQRRTRELLEEVARLLDLAPSERLIEGWLEEIHAPVGLDLGAEAPAAIALSILSEIQKVIAGGTGLALKQVRGTKVFSESAS